MHRMVLVLAIVLLCPFAYAGAVVAEPSPKSDLDALYAMLDQYLETLPEGEREKVDTELRSVLDDFAIGYPSEPDGEGAPSVQSQTLEDGSLAHSSTSQSGSGAVAMMQQVATRFAPGAVVIKVLGTAQCLDDSAGSQGQQMRLTGDGFAPGASVQVEFACCDGFLSQLGPVVADSGGAIDATVTIPSGFSTPALSGLSLYGDSPTANVRRVLSGQLLVGPASPPDSDGDALPDFCDNCPGDSNPGQEDADTDGIGDSCDSCPNDIRNDADGDGLCASDPLEPCPFDAQNDVDGDGVCGDIDNCPVDANADQADSDMNTVGDACQTMPTCSDGIDNDGDGRIDFPADKGCDSATDTTETSSLIPCDDGLDNDNDGLADYRSDLTRDPGCGWDTASTTAPENPACDDNVDNDGDGLVDWDGNFGLTDPDPDCQGYGFGTSEAVPEPGFVESTLAATVLVASFGVRHFRLQKR